MAAHELFNREKLVTGILISRLEYREDLLTALEAEFGPPDYISELLDFSFTRYYDKEMGAPIMRFFIAFEQLVEPDRLAAIKLITGKVEQSFLDKGNRKVNLDPGLLSLSRFILASTKDSSHRIPLSSGIYGEITLMYEKNEFRPVEWTYPDYQCEKYRLILKEIRALYVKQLERQLEQ